MGGVVLLKMGGIVLLKMGGIVLLKMGGIVLLKMGGIVLLKNGWHSFTWCCLESAALLTIFHLALSLLIICVQFIHMNNAEDCRNQS
jgi:predicted tellurium resistance membrane protein TerC